MRKRHLHQVRICFYVTLSLAAAWVLGWSYHIVAGERPKKDIREEAMERVLQKLEEITQKVDKAVPLPVPVKSVSQSNGADMEKLLSDLKLAVGTNLAIKDHTDRTANWALWTLQLMGAIAFIAFVASALGGYVFLQGHKEQTELSNNASKLQVEVAKTRDQTVRLRDSAKRIVSTMNDDAKKMRALTTGFSSWNETNLSKFERIFVTFDFSRLDTVIGPLLITEEKSLPSEEESRLEDFDVQIQVGEVFNATINPEIYIKLGRFYAYKANLGKALARFNDALERDPTIFDGWASKAICLGQLSSDDPSPQGKQDLLREAYKSLDKARLLIKDQIQNFQFYFVEAWLLMEEQKYESALTALEKAIAHRADSNADYNIVCALARSGKLEEAFKKLEMLKEYPHLIQSAEEDIDLKPLRQEPTLGLLLAELIAGVSFWTRSEEDMA